MVGANLNPPAVEEVNTNLATTNWVTPTETVTDNGIIKYILVNPPPGNRFYQLQNP
jgi:hypothetical protein